MITLQTYIIRDKEAIWRRIDDEAFIIDQEGGNIFTLNKTAAYIWELAAEKITISEIFEHICDRFEIDESTALSDINEFLNKMLEKPIIKIIEQP